MRRQPFLILGLGVLSLIAAPGGSPVAASEAPVGRDAAMLATRIDELVAARWAEKGVKPAAPSDDAEFLRRVYLDLAGRIPRVSEARAFLEDTAADKRLRLIDRLLESPYYVGHFTNVWRSQMMPPANNIQLQLVMPSFEVWLRTRIRDNVGYDQLVRELLTTPVALNQGRQQFLANNGTQPTAIAYYQANELKPETLGAATSRMFLGVKLECAQCHDHPFAKWSRQQFWEYSAFFAGIQGQGGNFFAGGQDRPDLRQLKIAGTEKVVQARFLDGTEPEWRSGTTTRTTLAEWMTRADNPFFARAAANRLWSHFFGIGLIEPVDEPGDDNPPSHPELLDELARQFAGHQFDVQFLIRAILASKTYQLSSAGGESGQGDPRLFARMAVKGLTPEQLFDSLAQATGYREPERSLDPRALLLNGSTPRGDFLSKFASQGKRTEHQTSILQALALMNGRFIADATSLQRSEVLAAVTDAPFLDTAQRIEALYLASLTRKPTATESARMLRYVEAGGAKKDPKVALADVFWVLLNSSEFMLNH
jgi:hypothetical protein